MRAPESRSQPARRSRISGRRARRRWLREQGPVIGLAFALGVAVGACCYHDKISKPKVADAFNRGKAVGVRAAERERELWRYRGAIDAAQGRLSAEPIEIVKRWRVREEGTAGIVYSEIEQQKSSDDSEGDLVRWAA